MAALQKFNRSPTTHNNEDWPPDTNALQLVRQRKVMAMKGLPKPSKDVSFTPGKKGLGTPKKGF